jgi:transcriptional regulator with XRE-family HTH domain
VSDRVAESAVQIGRGIRKLRKQRRWKQDVLAEESGISRVTISLAENAKTNLSLFDLERLAKALDTDVSGVLSAGRTSLRSSNEKLNKLVASNIRSRRLALGLSRQDAAKRISLLPQYLSTTENARRLPSVKNFQKIAVGLETKVSWLISSDYDSRHPQLQNFEYSDLSVLPALIRELREAKGMSRQEVARGGGLDAHHVAKVEDGKSLPTIQTLFVLSAALGVPISKLVD